MRFKIQGSHAQAGEPALCVDCRHAMVVRGARLQDEIIECRMLETDSKRMTFQVTFCTCHVSRSHASIHEMEDIAWILRTDARRRQVGFVRAKDLKPSERYVLPDEL